MACVLLGQPQSNEIPLMACVLLGQPQSNEIPLVACVLLGQPETSKTPLVIDILYGMQSLSIGIGVGPSVMDNRGYTVLKRNTPPPSPLPPCLFDCIHVGFGNFVD